MKKCNRKRLTRKETFSRSVDKVIRRLNSSIGNYRAVKDFGLTGSGRTYENGELKNVRFRLTNEREYPRSWDEPMMRK